MLNSVTHVAVEMHISPYIRGNLRREHFGQRIAASGRIVQYYSSDGCTYDRRSWLKVTDLFMEEGCN